MPKCNNATSLKNFCPISLCNTSYKIITKLITQRLHPLMNNLIVPCQSSFLKNRQTGDNAIVVQKIINHFKNSKGKLGCFLMKIDLEKAFDKLEWFFIHHTLMYFYLPTKLINLIMACICSSSTTILINGTQTNFFNPTRGIRQGDPISPYIFILCMEVLSLNISGAVHEKGWDPIRIYRRGPSLSYLFFADDLVLMSSTKSASCYSINSFLTNFCSWSGQNINFSKSKILSLKTTLRN